MKNKSVHRISYLLQIDESELLYCTMELRKPNSRKKLDEKLALLFELQTVFRGKCDYSVKLLTGEASQVEPQARLFSGEQLQAGRLDAAELPCAAAPAFLLGEKLGKASKIKAFRLFLTAF